jgi:hypothetical protein
MRIIEYSFIPFVAAGAVSALLLCHGATTRAQDASPAATAPSQTSSASSAQTAETEFGDGVMVELISVTRGESDITVKFKYTNNGSKQAQFNHSNYSFGNIAETVYYIDPKNKKKYTAIKDAENKPLASLMANLSLEPGQSKPGWCKLPAPPADVTSITVVLPGAAPFEKVRLAPQ